MLHCPSGPWGAQFLLSSTAWTCFSLCVPLDGAMKKTEERREVVIVCGLAATHGGLEV